MLRRPITCCLICLLLVSGCALPCRRNTVEPAEQTQTAANPPWIRYEGLDEYPVLPFICAVWLKTAAVVGVVVGGVLLSDDGPPNDLDQAMDQAAQAKEAKERHDQLCEQAAKLSASK
jgi:hypothetical protein